MFIIIFFIVDDYKLTTTTRNNNVCASRIRGALDSFYFIAGTKNNNLSIVSLSITNVL